MAKKSAVEKNKRRTRLAAAQVAKRARLKAVTRDASVPADERFRAQLKLAEMPRNGSKTRIRNRCAVSGRPRGYYRKLGVSRVALRELGSLGLIPGLVKSSW